MTARIIWTELTLLFREPLTLFVSLGFPLLLMVLLAGSFGSEPDPDFGGVSGIDFYVPVYMCASIAVMGFLGVPTHMAAYREAGVMRRFRLAGVRAGVLVTAQIVITAMLASFGVVLMVVVGYGVFDLSTPSSPLGVVVAFVIGTVALAAIGVLLGAVLPTARSAQGLGMLLFFVLFFISGGGPPPSMLPDGINTAVAFTPMGPLVDAVTTPWHDASWDTVALAKLAGAAVVAMPFAIRALRSAHLDD